MNPTPTELDTFKVMSNVDFVDWSRASKLRVKQLDDLSDDDDDNGHDILELTRKNATFEIAVEEPVKKDKYEEVVENVSDTREVYETATNGSPPYVEPYSHNQTEYSKNMTTPDFFAPSRGTITTASYFTYEEQSPEKESFNTKQKDQQQEEDMEPIRGGGMVEEFREAYYAKRREFQSGEREESTPRSVSYDKPRNSDEQPERKTSTPTHEPESKQTPPQETTGTRQMRPMPKYRKISAQEENEDYEIFAEKEALLQDLLQIEKSGSVKLTRQWNVNVHTLDELQFEFDRVQSELNSAQTVDMVKMGIKFGVGGLEALLKKAGISSVDGWSADCTKDMSKYNRPLTRIYKKYYRKSSSSPLAELGFILIGSLVWTVVQNKMGMRKSSNPEPSQSVPAPRAAAYEPPSSSTAPSTGGMKPPGMRPPRGPLAGSSLKGPSWTTPSTSDSSSSSSSSSSSAAGATTVEAYGPQPVVSPAALVAQVSASTPAAPAPVIVDTSALTNTMNSMMSSMNSQNEAILKMLSTLATSATKKSRSRSRSRTRKHRSRSSSYSSSSSSSSSRSDRKNQKISKGIRSKLSSKTSSKASSKASHASSTKLRIALAPTNQTAGKRTATARRKAAAEVLTL
jgi:hypothetical protein